MSQRRYDEALKQQVLEECRQLGNISLVARRHEIAKSTVHSWLRSTRKRGSTKALPRESTQRTVELERRLQEISSENEQLKRIVAEKELELAILRELRDKVNPR